MLLAAALMLSFTPSHAQQAKDIVGAWSHDQNVNNTDGKTSDLFGPNPKGQALFSPDGRFAIIFHRNDLPKLASNNRAKGTAQENASVMAGLIALYGSYTVADKVIVLKVEGSSFPNWVGTEQRRPIASLTKDELRIVNEGGSAGGRNELTLRRIR
jgi:hypothetical protein